MGMDVKQGKGKGPSAAINITPLVDVVLVLLIIFMVVTPLLVRQLETKLPQSSEDVAPPDKDEPDPIVVLVKADGAVTVNDDAVKNADLVGRIAQLLKDQTDKTVFVQAEDAARYKQLIRAMDAARVAGANNVGTILKQPKDEAEASTGGDSAPSGDTSVPGAATP